jgi:hypothetical protein
MKLLIDECLPRALKVPVPGVAQCGKPQTKRGVKIDAAGLETRCRRRRPPHKNRRGAQRFQHIAVQTIVVCRLRTVLELGRPRKTMACPTANLLYSYFLERCTS